MFLVSRKGTFSKEISVISFRFNMEIYSVQKKRFIFDSNLKKVRSNMTRSSGILLHISSLPGKYGVGTLGEEAYAFVDFLRETDQKLWQILPLGPTGFGNSPYQSYSAFAGSDLLIGVDRLVKDNLLRKSELDKLTEFSDKKVEYEQVAPVKTALLKKAFKRFNEKFDLYKEDYFNFLGEHSWWLDDYSLFQSLKEQEPDLIWNKWKKPIKQRDQLAVDKAHLEFAEAINYQRFIQFIFFKQWFDLKKYANNHGVQLFGDMPLYVSLDSADVWGNQDIFLLDDKGKPTHVGGVPPDYFSETGQLWGNPVFDWERLAERDFDWWIARLHFSFKMYDLIRIDHFRGLESFWSVKAGEKTAIKGEWVPAKGLELMKLLKSQIGELPVIAEDLGVITPEVENLRDEFELAGMKVLQFAYASDETNEHLPHNFGENFVVYTGTHDNDTTLGWIKSATIDERQNLKCYFNEGVAKLPDRIIEAAWASVARMAIVPMQDLLALDSKGRMNVPGTAVGNWEWRFKWEQLKSSKKEYLKELTKRYNRL
ncbi:4-alpha-glucanotransferase [Sunxiuqinia indica]|uniref:4-alpha-glucanotransferase n=1 Tax=Sunxiuqinia indica TaxID=2692584 RepID=UPI00293BB6D0|nr:4-alpha-glucanotransferase [Sunxiuqinia indica]